MFKDRIDTQKGIAYLAGKKEGYVRIVNKFIGKKESNIADLDRFFSESEFDRLTIEFHGLKSTSATLGSELLPPLALELEIAGREGDHQLIKEKYDAFIEQYKDTCDALTDALTKI